MYITKNGVASSLSTSTTKPVTKTTSTGNTAADQARQRATNPTTTINLTATKKQSTPSTVSGNTVSGNTVSGNTIIDLPLKQQQRNSLTDALNTKKQKVSILNKTNTSTSAIAQLEAAKGKSKVRDKKVTNTGNATANIQATKGINLRNAKVGSIKKISQKQGQTSYLRNAIDNGQTSQIHLKKDSSKNTYSSVLHRDESWWKKNKNATADIQISKGIMKNKTEIKDRYDRFSNSKHVNGVDISSYQGDVNFEKLKNHVGFVIIRAGVGVDEQDEKFLTNVKAASNAKIPTGTYIASYATTTARFKEEAEKMISYLEQCPKDTLDMPAFIDFEAKRGKISKEQVNEGLRTYCETVQAAGYTPGVYIHSAIYDDVDPDIKEKYAMWIIDGKDYEDEIDIPSIDRNNVDEKYTDRIDDNVYMVQVSEMGDNSNVGVGGDSVDINFMSGEKYNEAIGKKYTS